MAVVHQQPPPAWAMAPYASPQQGMVPATSPIYPGYMVSPGQTPYSPSGYFAPAQQPHQPQQMQAAHPSPMYPTASPHTAYPPPTPFGAQAATGPPAGALSKEQGSVLCPACHKLSATRVTYVSGGATQLWAAVLCFTTCILTPVPYCFDCFKDAQHRCDLCGAHIATYLRSSGNTNTFY